MNRSKHTIVALCLSTKVAVTRDAIFPSFVGFLF